MDNPSLNCVSAWKTINGMIEIAIKSKYGIAKSTTSFGCFIEYITGLATNNTPNKKTAKIVQSTSPCLNADLPPNISYAASASATSGVIAVENPIPNDIAMYIKFFHKY